MSPAVQKATGKGKETEDELATPLPCLLCYILLILNQSLGVILLQSHRWPKSTCLFSSEVYMSISDFHQSLTLQLHLILYSKLWLK